jgi:hypothetical protein
MILNNKYSGIQIIKTMSGLLLILIPVTFYYLKVFELSINIPFWDEYGTALGWMRLYLDSSGYNRFLLLFYQANEHRLITYQLTVISDYYLFGEINFRHILIFGNLGMIGLAYALFKLNPIFKTNTLVFVPVILLLFVPLGSVSDWGIVASVIILIYITVLLSLYFLNKKGIINFSVAIILAIITTFSFGNGMFVFLSGFLVLVLSPNKSLPRILIWTAAMVVCVALYFTDYSFAVGTNSKTAFLQSPLQTMEIFLTFFAGFMNPILSSGTLIYTILGSIIFSYSCYLIFFKWREIKKYPVALSFLIFIIITAATMAVSRVGVGVMVSFANRYFIVQVLYISILYIISVNIYKGINNWFLMFIIVIGIITYVERSHVGVNNMERNRALRAKGLMSYYINPDSTSLGHPIPEEGSKTIDWAKESGYFNPPTMDELLSDKALQEKIKAIDQIRRVKSNVFSKESYTLVGTSTKLSDIPILDKSTNCFLDVINHKKPIGVVQIDGKQVSFSGWAIDGINDTLPAAVFVDIDGKYFEARDGYPRKGVAKIHGSKFLNSGFHITINTDLLEEGKHNVMIKVLSADKTSFYKPKSTFSIQIKK